MSGIYALERIAIDYLDEYYGPVMEVLTAYGRGHSQKSQMINSTAGEVAAAPTVCLVGAHLEGALLANARLENAELRNAHLEGADVRGAMLSGANFEGTDLAGIIGLSQVEVNKCRLNHQTVLPEGFTHPALDRPDPDGERAADQG